MALSMMNGIPQIISFKWYTIMCSVGLKLQFHKICGLLHSSERV